MGIEKQKLVWFLLRFGVAFTFLYAAVLAFINPNPWISYFPEFIRSNYSTEFLLGTWGVAEIVIGLWILSGYKIFLPSVMATLFLAGIFYFDYDSMPIIFRNVSILATTIALAILSYPRKQNVPTY